MMDLRDEFGMAIIVIAHNMGVVSETADRVLVMYAGRIVEEAPVARLFDHPLLPIRAACWNGFPRSSRTTSAWWRSRTCCPTWRAAPPVAVSRPLALRRAGLLCGRPAAGHL
jgi:ABC-type dipeptide/oligopeptide/nickel transport system ATPase component